MERRINVYTCRNGHQLVTIDRDPGVTPMFMTCDICLERSTSSMYADHLKNQIPTHEWYKPEPKEYAMQTESMKEHIDQGGLMFRKIPIERSEYLMGKWEAPSTVGEMQKLMMDISKKEAAGESKEDIIQGFIDPAAAAWDDFETAKKRQEFEYIIGVDPAKSDNDRAVVNVYKQVPGKEGTEFKLKLSEDWAGGPKDPDLLKPEEIAAMYESSEKVMLLAQGTEEDALAALGEAVFKESITRIFEGWESDEYKVTLLKELMIEYGLYKKPE